MTNYKILKLDLNLLSEDELECYLLLSKTVRRISGQEDDEDDPMKLIKEIPDPTEDETDDEQ